MDGHLSYPEASTRDGYFRSLSMKLKAEEKLPQGLIQSTLVRRLSVSLFSLAHHIKLNTFPEC